MTEPRSVAAYVPSLRDQVTRSSAGIVMLAEAGSVAEVAHAFMAKPGPRGKKEVDLSLTGLAKRFLWRERDLRKEPSLPNKMP